MITCAIEDRLIQFWFIISKGNMFSNEEGFDMLMVFGECRQNYRAAECLHRKRYPQRVPQSREIFRRMAFRVQATGQLQPQHNQNREIRRPVRDKRVVDVLAAVAVNPHDSTRRISVDSAMSQMTV
ncbi:hypothetical protein RF55_21883 [Lasius niger]|uniref:DUF4817 domain-containing protein n=1 Tax=Lasius niger TaxID=67767 RepID=A0A0J7MQD9_LASNI|nr:hypothetical protein RF55_21883 [Lasius niger]